LLFRAAYNFFQCGKEDYASGTSDVQIPSTAAIKSYFDDSIQKLLKQWHYCPRWRRVSNACSS